MKTRQFTSPKTDRDIYLQRIPDNYNYFLLFAYN